MALTDNNDNLSIAPLLVLITVPGTQPRCVGAGCAPDRWSRANPTRNGSLRWTAPAVDDDRAAGYHDHN